jgi:microcystin-dependent protein
MKQTILLITFLAGLGASALAQVGIGNVIPDTNSILDLRNTNNRGFLLPDAPGIMPASPKGLMYYNQTENFIYYSDTGGYNALSAWRFKYNGASSNNAYYNFGGNVGIGLPDPQLKLHLKGNDYLLGIEGSSKAGIAFYRTGYSNGRSSRIYQSNSKLYITNYESGDDISLQVTSGSKVEVYGGDLNVASGKVQEKGRDLIPKGVIVMWNGSTQSIPSGWALCNGNNGTPDLRGRFIVAAGSRSDKRLRDDGTTYSNSTENFTVNKKGGYDRVMLTTKEMPEHWHGGDFLLTSSGGSHRHEVKLTYGKGAGSNSKRLAMVGSGGTTSKDTDDAGDHRHTVNGYTGFTGSSYSHENTPVYYSLAYMMKL